MKLKANYFGIDIEELIKELDEIKTLYNNNDVRFDYNICSDATGYVAKFQLYER